MALLSANPFYQPAKQWQVHLTAMQSHVEALEEAFFDIALATMSHETDEAQRAWQVDILLNHCPEPAEIESRLALVAHMHGFTPPTFHIAPLADKDWIEEVKRTFPPQKAGRFYVYGSHVDEHMPHGYHGIQLDAGAAFGSGEHPTTRQCLEALSSIAKFYHPHAVLDMGCGSGILAIAAAQLLRCPVVGIDIDPVSVKVAKSNARVNQVAARTHFATGSGYHTPCVRRHVPYDLILANILARPLVHMARALATVLSPGGLVILSGLLVSQEHYVLQAHRLHGLVLYQRRHQDGWSCLILRKSSHAL